MPRFTIQLDQLVLIEETDQTELMMGPRKTHDNGYQRTSEGLAESRERCVLLAAGNGLVTKATDDEHICPYVGDDPRYMYTEIITSNTETVTIHCKEETMFRPCTIHVSHKSGWRLGASFKRELLSNWRELSELMITYFDQNLRDC